MKQQPFDGQNRVWKHPSGDPSADLPVHQDHNSMYSEWEPSPTERAAIAAGGRVCLWVFSSIHPPVAMGVRGYTTQVTAATSEAKPALRAKGGGDAA